MKITMSNWRDYIVEEKFRKRVSNVFIFNEQGQFLIIRRTDTAPWRPNHWDIPGGIVEDGELYEDAAIREAKEEVQLDVFNLVRVDGTKGNRRYFVTDEWQGNVELLPNPEHGGLEHSEFRWVTPEEYSQYDMKGIHPANVFCALESLQVNKNNQNSV